MTDWKSRWERGETGWHQREVEPLLRRHFPARERSRVFVPLCGKSLDLAWLAEQGHEVVGVELSEIACRAFFEENRIPMREERAGSYVRYSGKHPKGGDVTLWCGDFFELRPEHLAGASAWYDRAATIALSPELRTRYTARLQELMLASAATAGLAAQGLLIVLEYPQEKMEGPPFSVTEREIQAAYGKNFSAELVSRERVPFGEGTPLHDSPVFENAFVFRARGN